ncbi:HpcH/HpaI aldolase/citrate lyase family protein [Blastococcus saxobsidens]|uniref:Citrate lyase subunit beta/citryl-CoA lyase n=1 Tax=Blastococcus saxobsidens TaxID=138336 RepID=A0A4Q7YBA1_9ACTN|nr:CoA ester lyase [Blastococcus saxobsidens]RZU34148.1 citrate lyase subunit beta/citryl-CoA lyase [Blastococcus saxobsidens]
MTGSAVPPPPGRRRCVLSVPAGDARKVAKALGSAADELVLDLEDAVAVGDKDAARELLVATLHDLEPRRAPILTVRVNAPGSPWCHADLLALAVLPRPPATVVVPKVESAGDLAFVDRLLAGAEAGRAAVVPMTVQALIETAAGLERVQEIARSSPRLVSLVLGYADLAASLGMTAPAPDRLDLWLPAQQALLVAARAAGIQAIDGPHLGVGVDEHFARDVGRARDLGFDGKWAIHPAQLEPITAAFTPSGSEVAAAREVLDTLARAAVAGAGAAQLHGQMLDEAVAAAARRVLARSAGDPAEDGA